MTSFEFREDRLAERFTEERSQEHYVDERQIEIPFGQAEEISAAVGEVLELQSTGAEAAASTLEEGIQEIAEPTVEATLEPTTPLPVTLNFDETQMSLPAALCDERLLEELKAIPPKMGFKIGEVADMLGIKQYVLRYWETEFEVLKPKKANNNQRYFTRKDVENAYLIRKLLHRDRFSIEGARAAMKGLKSFVKKEVRKEQDLTHLRGEFATLHERVDELLQDIQSMRQLFA